MNETQIHERLSSSGIDGVGELDSSASDPFFTVDVEAIVPVLTFLRDDPECTMEMLNLVTAIERETSIEVAYHLSSLTRHHTATVKVILPRPEGGNDENWLPQVPSVSGVYRSADWHEREQWDLLGVRFTGHPDPRRILLPEEWIGHPLRKTYVYPSEHGGMPLELDATPIYERGPDWDPDKEKHESRPAGSPLVQPPSDVSARPDGGGKAPAESKAERHRIGPLDGSDDGHGGGAH